ncbi:hypothetical protein [Paracoccus sp. IB05]|uniref:hypothetical protein n=1 Tax=Paracoccus sp. IB05 TaxID=2779367 RepID=UPI0018E7CABB|nr:hypothetical protein [Paracoccus sp. IB05]MBJ2152301.1 hypothetical protein [Paracoccus sp. IB05]
MMELLSFFTKIFELGGTHRAKIDECRQKISELNSEIWIIISRVRNETSEALVDLSLRASAIDPALLQTEAFRQLKEYREAVDQVLFQTQEHRQHMLAATASDLQSWRKLHSMMMQRKSLAVQGQEWTASLIAQMNAVLKHAASARD